MRGLWGVLCVLLACAPVPQPGPTSQGPIAAAPPPQPAQPPQRSNAQMAQDFLDLNFALESGQPLPVLTRFEGAVTVALTGAVPATARHDLTQLLFRLRAEAGLDLRPAAPLTAAITVEFAPKAVLRRLEPAASCFVAPGISSLAEYRARRRSLQWHGLVRRQRVAVFIPSDTSPQEIRDCLHEEVAQALGPLNDLYRLPDSVFNDDNFQSTLTGFDMLMLRLHYAPQLASGMTEAQVAQRLPALLDSLNPAGRGGPGWSNAATPPAFAYDVGRALGPGLAAPARRAAATRLLTLAQAQGWDDARLGLAHFALGRLQTADTPAQAMAAFAAAAQVYAGLPDGGVHLSHAQMHLAALSLALGSAAQAAALADQALPAARADQNAALTASLTLIKAQALLQMGRVPEAAALRLDSLAAARYGFGSAQAVRDWAAGIARLGPAPPVAPGPGLGRK